MKFSKNMLVGALLLSIANQALSASAEREEAVIRGVSYIGVSVSDIEQSVDTYSSAADMELVSQGMLAQSSALDDLAGHELEAETQLVKSINAQLRFMQFIGSDSVAEQNEPVNVYGPGIAHVCFQVAKRTNTYQQFLEAGATTIGDSDMVQLNERNPVDYAYIHDHDHLILEIEHIDFEKVSRPRNNDYRIRHVSLATPNMERMVAFYSVLMEEPEPRRAGIGGTLAGENFDKVSGLAGSKLEMAWFQVRNLELELIQYHSHPTEMPNTPRPIDAYGYNMVMFDVSSLSAARAKLIEAGGIVVSESKELDGVDVLFGRDPDGNLLGFQVLDKTNPLSAKNFSGNGV